MAIKPWRAFTQIAEPDLPECPSTLMVDKAKECIRYLCRRSTILREWLPDQDIVLDVDEYTLVPSAGTQIVAPVYVEIDKIPLKPLDEEATDHASSFWRQNGGVTYRYHLLDMTTLKLTWLPDATVTDSLRVRVIVEPTRDAAGVDDMVYDRWADGIASGIKAKCMQMTGKPWSSDHWRGHMVAFNNAVGDAYAVANRGTTRRAMRVRMTPLAHGGGIR